ncbi:MAG: superoxide dismutase [Bacteroidia bacterium]|nr:superoxide dismutase [Bacteroidia bacterium]
MDRRSFLMTFAALALGGVSWARRRTKPYVWMEASLTGSYPYTLPDLPYPYEAIEPAIDTQTMKVHHQGHHATYVNNLNKALEELPSFQTQPLEDLLSNLEKVPMPQRTAIRNNGGGHWNHTFWWKLLAPKPQEPSVSLQKRIALEFESWTSFRAQLLEAAVKHFGSGWAWVVLTPAGKLRIVTTPNQDNPLMPYSDVRGKPILGIDVWEHAYYLKYQNRRSEYLANLWQRLNWEYVETLLG